MIKNITKATLVLFLGASTLMAQEATPRAMELTPGKDSKILPTPVHTKVTKIWGAEATTGTADGEFQNNFVQTTNQGNYDPSNWSSVSIFESDGVFVPGSAYWTRSITGESQGLFWDLQSPIASPTQANGCALFDSDFLDNGGIGLGSGTSPGGHEGWLVSPRMDLTGYTDSVFTVKFFCKWRAFNVPTFSVSMSTDDGTTWEERSIRAELPSLDGAANEGWVKVIFPNTGMGVANMTQCRVRFKFSGYYYYAMVDDVTVESTPNWDLAAGANNLMANTIGENTAQIQLMNNAHIPVSGVDDPNDFIYGINIRNRGHLTGHGSFGSDLLAVVSRWDQTNGWVEVHRDSTAIPNIPVASSAFVTDTMTDYSWATVGEYRVLYTIRVPWEFDLSNNEWLSTFEINDDTYASKVDIDPNGGPLATTRVFPGGTTFEKFEYGSLFTFDQGGTNALRVDSISQVFYVPSNYAGSSNVKYRVNLYEWVDIDSSLTIDSPEMTLVASGLDSLDLTNVPPVSYLWNRTALTDLTTGILGHNLNDNTKYIAMVSLEAADNDMTEFNSNNMVWLGISNQEDLGGNYLYSEGKAHFLRLVYPGNVEQVNDIGFGVRTVPAMGLHLADECFQLTADMDFDENFMDVDFTDESSATPAADSWSWDFGDGNTSTDQDPSHTYTTPGQYTVCLTASNVCSSDTICDTVEVELNTNSLSESWMDQVLVFPVPAEDFVSVKNVPTGAITIELRNLVGQIVFEQSYESHEALEVPVSHLAAGQYNLILRTDSGATVKSVIVQ